MINNQPVFSLLGNPNCGKTAVFNLLTGLDQKVSNYPGITVEKKIASVQIDGNLISFEDYPGAYSSHPQSLDEKIVHDTLFSWMEGSAPKPNGIIYVADSTNLRRNSRDWTSENTLSAIVLLITGIRFHQRWSVPQP